MSSVTCKTMFLTHQFPLSQVAYFLINMVVIATSILFLALLGEFVLVREEPPS